MIFCSLFTQSLIQILLLRFHIQLIAVSTTDYGYQFSFGGLKTSGSAYGVMAKGHFFYISIHSTFINFQFPRIIDCHRTIFVCTKHPAYHRAIHYFQPIVKAIRNNTALILHDFIIQSLIRFHPIIPWQIIKAVHLLQINRTF